MAIGQRRDSVSVKHFDWSFIYNVISWFVLNGVAVGLLIEIDIAGAMKVWRSTANK